MSISTRTSLGIALVAFAIAIGPDPVHAALAQDASQSAIASKSTTAQGSAATTAVVEQPRGTGYFVGDKVTQRVLLESAGQTVAPVSLPPPGRVSAWFERRSASMQTDSSSRRWLVIDYQILNAPPKLVTVKLPAWSLPIREAGPTGANSTPTGRGAPAALAIPAASVNIAPLSLPGSPTQVGTADLRPDRLPPVIATAPIWGSIEASAGAFCATLIAWLGWVVWRNRRALATQPFASALREMRTLADGEPRAWQALHRAFDRTAGRVIQHSTLPTLFERAPQLIPARSQIEQFFAQSSLLFFTAPASSDRLSAGRVSPRALCAELRQIEKRYER
jgi:mxaA protein